MSFKSLKNMSLVIAASAVFTVSAAAPESYLEYVATDGSAYVDTGVIGKAGTKVEAGMMWSSISGDIAFVGARNNTDGRYLPIHVYDNKWWFGYKNQKGGKGTPAANTYYTVVSEVTSAGVYTLNVNGETFSEDYSSSVGNYSSELPLYLFALSRESNGVNNKAPAGTRCYYLKIWQDGVLVRDYKPCLHNGLVALYDAQNDTYATPSAGVLLTKNMTITPSDPLWGAALTIADDITIDGGNGDRVWQGAITVNDGGSLKTRGNLNVGGTTLINANGTVTVETGSSYFMFSANYIKGNLTVNAGAELRMNVNEAFQGAATAVFNLYGTLDVAATRQRTDGGKFFFHDGSRVIGTGDAYGGLYAYRNSRVVFDGTVEIEPPIAGYNGYTFTAACCDNAHVSFKGGIKSNSSNQNTAKFVQEAATAEEGNASGTCASAFVEIGPCAYNGTLDFKGPITFVSNAKIALANASPSFTVTTSGASLEFVADKATAFANHATVQTLPAITTSTTTIRLTGDGVVALRDAAPSFPIEFAGASLFVANAPVTLAAGSSATAATTIGVDGLAANTAATLFTGADASFDVSKISARPAHNGVLMGTAAAATLSGTDVITAGVDAYDATAWMEPYIRTTALIWLDASDAANFEFKDNTFGLVTTWRDRSSYKRNATAYKLSRFDGIVYGTLGVADGVPAYLMGECNSGIDLSYSDMTLRTAFFVMSIRRDIAAFWLGYTGGYHFHRGSNGEYSYTSGGNQNNSWYCDGVKVAAVKTDLVPTDRHVYSVVTAANGTSNRLTSDRDATVAGRNGGREISELITFPTALSDSDRQTIEAYLAAKWMGANPTAAGTAGTYAVKGDLEVDDTISGTQNLDFAEGASVSISNPSSSAPMLSTTGAVTLPAGTPLPVSVDASGLVPGTYTVMQAGSGITSLSQFAPTATVGAGATATFAVVDGKLTMTIAVSSSATSQTWRPASSADLGWNATSANWLYDGGTTGGFIPYVPAFIDGAETATGDITVTGTQTAGAITLTGANDYTFKGDGTLAGGDTVTFGGTGTVTLDGASFGDQTIVITNGQKVVLGFNAAQNALGTDSGSSGGKVEISDGGQLNINYTETASSTTSPRAEITHHKTFSIAGDGPDGRGALINDALDGRGDLNPYGSQFRRIELTDDATVGGTHRMEVRAHTATSGTATPGIYGPGKRLTVKSTNPYGFGVVSQPINVGAITVASGATLRPEDVAESQIDIPGGITLDGGTLHGYASTYPATMPLHVAENGGTLNAASGTTVLKGALSVDAGGALNCIGSDSFVFRGPIQDGLTFNVSAGSYYLGSGSSGGTVNFVKPSGTCGFSTEAVAPAFDTVNFNVADGTCQFIVNGTSGILDVPGTININQAAGDTYVFGPAGNAGIKLKMVGTALRFCAGVPSDRPGLVHFKSGTDLTVTDFGTGGNNKSPAQGVIVIESGAKVTSTSRVLGGYWNTAPSKVANHVIDIYGELDASAATVSVQYDSPRSEIILREGGLLKAKQLYNGHARFKYGSGVGVSDGKTWFKMEGGRLELGSGGFSSAVIIPGVVKYDFQNGTFANAAAWTSMPYALPVYFGYEELGGSVDLDLGSYNVSWNSGLAGASDVTLKGSANFAGNRAAGGIVQGAMLGKLTVQNTGANDLRNASSFSGGLTLADGVNAQVAKYADEHYPYAVAGNYREDLSTNEWSLAYVAGANIWPFLHKRYSSGKPYGNTWSWTTRCEFYVPEAKAGTWTFCGAYDDYMLVQIDGVTVFNQAYNALSAHTVTLSTGWHKMIIAMYDGSGSAGLPASNGWNDGKSLGFIIGESTSTAGGDYTKFEPGASLGDDLTLQVRPAHNVCVWSWQNGNGSWDTTENWSHIKCIDTVAPMHKYSGGSDANDWKAYFSGKANKFEGWFKVEENQVGEWSFDVFYDDNKKFVIDGDVLVNVAATWSTVRNAKKTLTAGWHHWEIRVSDGSGGWGPNGTHNNYCTISYVAPDSPTEKRFDETNLKLAATLGDIAVLEPSGIYKELELGAGSTLTSAGTMAMPIFGTLKGTGTLAGDFAFAGTTNCWEVANAGAKTADLPAATFANATPATFAGLKNVKVTFDGKPTRSAYYLTGVVSGLSAAPEATVTAKDAAGTDYSANFTLTVKNGRLALSNSKPGGTIIIVR